MKKRYLAFLTRSLIDATGSNMWKGITTSCQKDNFPLITFRGPVLNKGQGSIIYHILTDNSAAGIISWASSDVDQRTTDFYKKFMKTPLVCMTFRIEGTPLIVTDCRTGEIELISHLIEVHGFKKIAFIRGPETHVYAKERFEGYIEGLKTHGIQINEDLISPPGGWSLADGAKAVDNWLMKGFKPGVDIDAIVAVGDNVAIGAQEHLISKGYSVPHDIAVCGFNGTDDAAWSNPPITSVEMPFYGQGIQAYKTLMAMINHENYEKEFRYSTKLVLGESCGCSSAAVKKAFLNINPKEHKNAKQLFSQKNAVLSSFEVAGIQTKFNNPKWQSDLRELLTAEISKERYMSSDIQEFFNSFIPRFISSFVADCLDNKSKPVFIQSLSKALNTYIKFTSEFSIWQSIITILREYVLTSFKDYNSFYIKSENLFQQARILINEVDCRIQKQSKLLEHRKEAALRLVSTEILSCSNLESLMNVITKSLPKIGVSGCFLAIYENCEYTEENHKIPAQSRILLAIKNNERISIPEEGVLFTTTDILPERFYRDDENPILEIESLHYADKYLGYIVFEADTDGATVYSTLRDQISCSLYSALLLEERNKSRQRLEATMQNMTEKADLVSAKSEGISVNINGISRSMDSVASNIKDISGNIGQVADSVEIANQMINEADTEIKALVESTEQITNAVHMINDIAEKTNVLALNAAIEAAHAGDAGRGFSVVAKEVKSLAAQTVSSTQAIQELVEKNNINTKQVETVINSTNKAIKTIAGLSEEIKSSIQEQVQSSTQVSQGLQEASSGAEQISNAITEIAKLGETIKI